MSKQHLDHGEEETMEKEGEDLSSLGKDLMQMVEELENLAKARRSLENDVVAARHSLAKERKIVQQFRNDHRRLADEALEMEIRSRRLNESFLNRDHEVQSLSREVENLETELLILSQERLEAKRVLEFEKSMKQELMGTLAKANREYQAQMHEREISKRDIAVHTRACANARSRIEGFKDAHADLLNKLQYS
ncbi:hypothetical protein GUITHDRAFT_155020 [Guillardia theta CCMP2712]|uniref:Uncharacterized protein n=1 Tax=Guillardia theta (strain CCMP2712) TaxID=905079 RepID=L1IN32_GUITC|nr:hypothetical protein GUITHDRAFT_155020 [Guillardia theta CCMP2712]EKX37205.1 hypothetical protein GUITHDRAFT_155020 [Guillardia theta CCMP2712]|eukprot:XP_005824185.1 hypothetical protein GUITHDRAFT_155020 [Guillardia theta CCMP2712]